MPSFYFILRAIELTSITSSYPRSREYIFDLSACDHWRRSCWLRTEGKPQASRRFLPKGDWYSNCNNRSCKDCRCVAKP
ncbi:hypothetical protein ACHAWT_006539 [Skeletonema menzelii]